METPISRPSQEKIAMTITPAILPTNTAFGGNAWRDGIRMHDIKMRRFDTPAPALLAQNATIPAQRTQFAVECRFPLHGQREQVIVSTLRNDTGSLVHLAAHVGNFHLPSPSRAEGFLGRSGIPPRAAGHKSRRGHGSAR